MKITSLDIWMTNCYLLETEKAAIVIDPAFKREKLVDFLKKNEHKERLILITHGHFTNSSVQSRKYTTSTGSLNTNAAKNPRGTA